MQVKVHLKFSICEGGNNVVLSLQILVRHIYPQHLPSNCAIYTNKYLYYLRQAQINPPEVGNVSTMSLVSLRGMIRRSRELFIQEKRVGCGVLVARDVNSNIC